MPRYTVDGSGADCKSAVNDSGGSTPSLGTNRNHVITVSNRQNGRPTPTAGRYKRGTNLWILRLALSIFIVLGRMPL